MVIVKKIIILVICLILFFSAVNKASAADSTSFDMVRDILKILFENQDGTGIHNPPITGPHNPPVTYPPISGPPVDPSVDRYLPTPLNPISNNLSASEKSGVLFCQSKKSIYEQAGAYRGINWQILAAIHYLEASCGDGSLVSGRAIGSNEPDVVAGEGCSSAVSGPGVPYPIAGGGCAFRSLIDTAIYAARHLQGKIGKNPENYQELVTALGRYNGLGNRNCGKTPYSGCPPYFESEDHIYPVNWLDGRHDTMYLIYCADGRTCPTPQPVRRIPGGITILRILSGR